MQSKLDDRFELITIDLPGHGKSEVQATSFMTPEILAEMVHKSLINEGINRFHLVGNSLGGWISLEMATKFPDNVQSVKIGRAHV